MARIFISYRRADSSSLATLIAKDLEKQGINVFVDTRKVDGGGPFPNRLHSAIEKCDVFVCLLGETTLDSDWVLEEIKHAHEQGKVLIPVFQESYTAPDPIPTEHVYALLQSDGVHILDIKNIYVDEAIGQIGKMVKQSAPRRNLSTIWIIAVLILLIPFIFYGLMSLIKIISPPETSVTVTDTETSTPTNTATSTAMPIDTATNTATNTDTPPIQRQTHQYQAIHQHPPTPLIHY